MRIHEENKEIRYPSQKLSTILIPDGFKTMSLFIT